MTNLKRVWASQRYNAKYRGIAFELSFTHWLRIWKWSGHLHERGRKKGQYVMARKGDIGPYAAWNVSIELVSKNCADGNVGTSRLRGRKQSVAHRRAVSNSLRGHAVSDETRRKIGVANAKALKGRVQSDAHKASISRALRGVPKSDSMRRNLSAALIGHKISAETRAKISASLRARAG